MLPVVVTPAQNMPLLGAGDLGPDVETCRRKALRDLCRMQRTMPDVSHISLKQRLGRPPVGAVVVQHLARPFGLLGASLVAPSRIIVDAIGRIADHEMRKHATQQPFHGRFVGRIAADDPIVAKLPDSPEV